MNNFELLGLEEPIIKAINDLGFTEPTHIQEKTIPLLLNEETDLVALAQTGTGKTAAFGFPLIQKIDPSVRKTQAIILAPTRELCLQITNEMHLYSKYYPRINTVAVYGGASIMTQAKLLKQGAHIIVATPGRMLDMQKRKFADITEIKYCVLDEADEMLNMGFYEDITNILEVTVGHKNQGPQSISHEFYLVNARDRYIALKRLADANPDIFSVVFCRTKKDTQDIADRLIADGYNAASLHGDLSQAQRDTVMKAFRGKQLNMLVATDVAARGIDVDDITHVINYQLPDEIEVYTHRSGRTGRAGKSGTSMVIITKSELRKINAIERLIKQRFEEKPIPSGIEICEVQLFHLANKIKEVKTDHEIDSYLPVIFDLFSDLTKEDLIKKMVSVEFNRFLQYYKNANEISVQSLERKGDKKSREESSDPNSVRYFINLGTRDNFDWKRLKDFLVAMLELTRDDVFKVDVKDNFSFFNTELQYKNRVFESFVNFKFEGRRVSVEISKNDSGGGKRRTSRESSFDRKKGKSNFDRKPKSWDFDNKSKKKSSSKDSFNQFSKFDINDNNSKRPKKNRKR